jgi:hypothetical protein
MVPQAHLVVAVLLELLELQVHLVVVEQAVVVVRLVHLELLEVVVHLEQVEQAELLV